MGAHTCTHDSMDPRFFHATLYITQVLNIPVGKNWDVHRLPVRERERERYEDINLRSTDLYLPQKNETAATLSTNS